MVQPKNSVWRTNVYKTWSVGAGQKTQTKITTKKKGTETT